MTTITTSNQAYSAPAGSQETIQPLPFWGSLIAFGLPALLMIFSYHVFMPRLQAAGLAPAESFVVAHVAPMAIMLAAALAVFHRLEGRPLTWAAFSQRYRYPRITLKAVLLGLVTFMALNIAYGLFSQLGATLAGQSLAPGIGVITSVADVLGISVQGRWEIVFLFLLVLPLNVVGEELWWRGIILPRQELTHGRWTWIVHGTLWTAFHAFKWWDLAGLLPVCLLIAYISRRTKNYWLALIAHALFNGLALYLVLAAVMV